MCCGLLCVVAGVVAGVGAFFSTAAISSQVFAASAAGTSGPAQMADMAMSALPIDPTTVPKVVPEVISGIAQVSGSVLLLEHVLFLLLGGWWLSGRLASLARRLAGGGGQQSQPLADLQQMQRLCDAVRALAGPESVFGWEDVNEAPPATMDMDALADGQVASHVDGRGAIYRFKLKGDAHVNMYYTKAGHMRSGDLHDSNQYDIVLKGRVRLTMKNPETLEEQVHEYRDNDFIIIPARWPHIFEFLEDNCLLEWWDGPFKAWYHRPMRQLIDERARQQQQQLQQQQHQQQQQQQAGSAMKAM